MKYNYVLHMTVHTSWTNKAIKLLQLPKKQNKNRIVLLSVRILPAA